MVIWGRTPTTVLMVLWMSEYVAAVEEVFMSDYCGSTATVRVDKSLVLHFEHSVDLPHRRVDTATRHCGLTVAAKDRTNRLLLHIISLHIDVDHPDRLHVYESAGQRFQRLSPASGLFGKYGGLVQISSHGITDYQTRRDTFYLDYVGVPTEEFDGFTILFTEFHDVSSVTGSCFGTFFECITSRKCIDTSLRCDTYRNCGEYDGSDETSCQHGLPEGSSEDTDDTTLPIALSVGIVATVTFLLVSLAIFLVTRLRRRQLVAGHQQSLSSTSEQRNGVPENDVNLATLYAPPSYEDVMTSRQTLNAENPPPYDSLVSLHIEEITPPVRRSRRTEIVQDESSFTQAPSPTGSRTSNTSGVFDTSQCDVDKDDDPSGNESGTRANGDIVIPYQRTGEGDILTFRRADV